MRNAASVNILVEYFVCIPSHKLKQMSVRPYKEQPISLNPHEGNHPMSATMSIATPFAVSADTSDHHATVGNCDSVSSMSTATWEPAAVQVYDSLTLALP